MDQSTSGSRKPNLFIVGAPKCGTTAWVEYLRTHPDIFFPEVKEPHYFAFDLPGVRWTKTLGDYEELFAPADGEKVVGEASVMYLYSASAAEAIRAYNPAAKILIFLRAQEDFLPSLHHQFLYRFTESIEDFEKAWRLSGRRPAETIPKLCRDPRLLDYAAIGRFREQVERYLAAFPAERIHVIRFEEWISNPRSTYLQILDFLDVEDDGRSEFPQINEAKSHKNKLLGRLIAHPPRALQAVMQLLRRASGRKVLQIGQRTANLLAEPGYRTFVPPELREEITRHYEEDNRLLSRKLSRVEAEVG